MITASMTFFAALTQLSVLRERTQRVQVNASWELILERPISIIITTALLFSLCQAYLSPGISLHYGLAWQATFPPSSSRCILKGVSILPWTTWSPLSPSDLSTAAHQLPRLFLLQPIHPHVLPSLPTHIILIASSGPHWLNKQPDNTVVLTLCLVRSLTCNDTRTEDIDNSLLLEHRVGETPHQACSSPLKWICFPAVTYRCKMAATLGSADRKANLPSMALSGLLPSSRGPTNVGKLSLSKACEQYWLTSVYLL